MTTHTLWYIVAPVCSPAPGGAAVYTKLLAEALAAGGADVVVATEAFPRTSRYGRTDYGLGSLVIDRIFPLRAGRASMDWHSYAAYAWQNLLMLTLPRRLANAVRETRPQRVIVVVQSSFFNKPSVLPYVMRRLRGQLPQKSRFIVDVRDPLFDESQIPIFSAFDAAIGCSRSIARRLRELLPGTVQVEHLPIPFDAEVPPTDEEVAALLSEQGLAGRPYVFNPNGILDSKRYPLILDAVRELRRTPGHEDTVLVTIGRARDWTTRDDRAVAEGVLVYLGIVPHRTSVMLAKGAKATLIVSPIEGVPRSALETLALHNRVVLPPIEEFLQHVPKLVLRSDDPADIARLVIQVSEKPVMEHYPLTDHSMTRLIPAYLALESGSDVRARWHTE